uniref:Uncharacterized protein n=1 Tax=Romanomermis culicivorax TaxID=13658 RepID=A0A915I6X2_ROMCU
VETEKIDNEIVKKEDIVSKQSITSDKVSELTEAIKKTRSERMVLEHKIQTQQKNLDNSTLYNFRESFVFQAGKERPRKKKRIVVSSKNEDKAAKEAKRYEIVDMLNKE